MFLNAGPLFGRAKAAYHRARDEANSRGISNRDMGTMDALEAVVFSVVALEGFMNEVIELASHRPPPGYPDPESVRSFATLVKEADKGRASLGLKFQLAHLSFAGTTYDVSSPLYQDFSLLHDLRNTLVHYRSRESFTQIEASEIVFNPAPILERMRSRNILVELDGNVSASWLMRISNVAVASWSCGVAASMVQSILDPLPPSYLQEIMERAYREPFQAP